MTSRKAVSRMTLLAVLLLAQAASAATAYYVTAGDVYARSAPQAYSMGRLYFDERMDIQYIDSNGWAYGYAYGFVQRCVWVQYRYYSDPPRFRTHGTAVSDKCRNTDRYLYEWEYSNGEIWNRGGTDGVFARLHSETPMWENWAWGQAWGNHHYKGNSPAGSLWKVRYTTYDGVGVMARPCSEANGTVTCYSNWMFILRSSF